jgi:hypothetical protein
MPVRAMSAPVRGMRGTGPTSLTSSAAGRRGIPTALCMSCLTYSRFGGFRGIPKPRLFRTVAPLGEQLAQPRIAQLPLAALVACLLHRQRLVVDESAGTGEAANVAFLRTVGLQLEFESLPALHELIIQLVHGNWKPTSAWEPLCLSDARTQGLRDIPAWCLHAQTLHDRRSIFASVCLDFESQLVELDGEDDPVHPLANYPPKIAVAALVNSQGPVPSAHPAEELPEHPTHVMG